MESVYQRIWEAVQAEGVVNDGFLEAEPGDDTSELCREGPLEGKQVRRLDGGWDCEIIYEYNYGDKDTEARVEKLKEATRFIAGEVSYERALERLTPCFADRKTGDLSYCLEEDFPEWLKPWLDDWPEANLEGAREGMDPARLFDFASRLLTESTSIEGVKYALTILAQREDMPPEQKDQVRTLALCAEFTQYCAPVLLSWENGMEELFQVARRVEGSGRIMAVRRLEPVTQEIRDWLLEEGWYEGMRFGYNAGKCAEEGRLRQRLEGPITPEQLERATRLVRTLLDDAVYMEQPGYMLIEEVEDADRLLLAWMAHLEDRELEFPLVKILSTILDVAKGYMENSWPESKQRERWSRVEERARGLLLAPKGRASVERVIQNGEDYLIGRKLGLEWREALLANAEQAAGGWVLSSFEPSLGNVHSGRNYYYELDLLFQEGEPWASRVIQVWEKGMLSEKQNSWNPDYWDLPRKRAIRLVDIDCRHLRHIVSQLEGYPGQGVSLVLMLLEVSTPTSGRRAMKVLEAWRDQGWAWTEEVERAVARRQEADAALAKVEAETAAKGEEDGDD